MGHKIKPPGEQHENMLPDLWPRSHGRNGRERFVIERMRIIHREQSWLARTGVPCEVCAQRRCVILVIAKRVHLEQEPREAKWRKERVSGFEHRARKCVSNFIQ